MNWRTVMNRTSLREWAGFSAVILAMILSLFRISGDVRIAFQAVAHVYVGLLIGVALGQKKWTYAYIAIALTAVELVMFVLTH
jgi:hypothetical protein